ncbi:leptin-like [Trematomus bernacchii]|uniref:Leptin n=1 Tax=Pagothenia borchgrevinki TaxID=8213 RepID=A0ABD2H6Q2_PAGBO|nr:leptin-like [Trematomus bernacchii]
MDNTLALLFPLLFIFSVGTAAPLPMDVVNMKSTVKRISETLVNSLNQHLQMQDESGWTLSPPAADPNGPSSVVIVLEGFNRKISSDSYFAVKQTKLHISSLTSYVREWMKAQCSEQQPRGSEPASLLRLKERSRPEFSDTVSTEALMRVREFLNLLLQNLDNLESC